MRTTFVNLMIEEARHNEKLELLTGDLGFGVLKQFIEEFPDRFTNCGIAEQNMLSMAGGMASIGKMPIVYSIGNFPSLRPFEQIRNDVCYYNHNVKIICVGGGYTYGNLGMSHHATEDIASLRALPNMTIFAPADKKETEIIVKRMFELKTPCYLRLERDVKNELHANDQYEFGGIYPVCINCNKTLLLSYGTIVNEAIEANANIDIATVPVLKPINEKAILKAIKSYSNIITLEEHSIIGGLGDIIADIISRNGLGIRLFKLGINDYFCHEVGSQQRLREINKLDKKGIVEFINSNSL